MRGRTTVLVVLAVVVGALAVGDRTVGTMTAEPPAPTAAPDLAARWYCGFGTAAPGGQAEVEVVVANPSGTERRATVTVVPEGGEPAERLVRVLPWSRTVVRARDVAAAPFAAAVVEADAGGLAVEIGVAGPLGFELAACAEEASETWYLAEGSTTKASTLLVGLLNPFPDDAIVDMGFATEQGSAVPAALQGVVVPPRSLVVRNVGDFVRRREAVSTSVRARSGRLVAFKLQLRADPGQRGITVGAAAPATARVWHLPEGAVREGVVERYHLYNPSDREARVDVELALDEGAVEPVGATIAPRDRVTIVANEVEGIVSGVGMSATVRALDGAGVVVERTLDFTGPRQGRTAALGTTEGSTRWVLGAGAATEGVEEWVVVQNTSDRAARIRVRVFGEGRVRVLDRLGGLEVPAGGRRGYRLNDVLEEAELSVLVDASAPVVVERGLYRVGRVGVSASPGVPVR